MHHGPPLVLLLWLLCVFWEAGEGRHFAYLFFFAGDKVSNLPVPPPGQTLPNFPFDDSWLVRELTGTSKGNILQYCSCRKWQAEDR